MGTLLSRVGARRAPNQPYVDSIKSLLRQAAAGSLSRGSEGPLHSSQHFIGTHSGCTVPSLYIRCKEETCSAEKAHETQIAQTVKIVAFTSSYFHKHQLIQSSYIHPRTLYLCTPLRLNDTLRVG